MTSFFYILGGKIFTISITVTDHSIVSTFPVLIPCWSVRRGGDRGAAGVQEVGPVGRRPGRVRPREGHHQGHVQRRPQESGLRGGFLH